jgi:hypothetical protein
MVGRAAELFRSFEESKPGSSLWLGRKNIGQVAIFPSLFCRDLPKNPVVANSYEAFEADYA